MTIFFVIYYFDRRCRLEDFDLHLLAQQVRGEEESSIGLAAKSSMIA